MHRLWLAFTCFFLILFRLRLPDEARALLPAAPPPSDKIDGAPAAAAGARAVSDGARGAVQLLALLQREGRLLDFLQEDIAGYADAEIGAAVRAIHRDCRRALAEHLPVEPVLAEADNATVRIDPGFDPARIRLVGNVVGEPPFTGRLKHHGWRAGRVTLPELARAADPSLVAPAEVELS